MADPGGEAERTSEERLDRFHAVAETALAHLGVEELLSELLDRAVTLLDADTAAVLLLDEASGELVATAARGLEEELRQGSRVPVGRGFAGRVAAEAAPVMLGRVDRTTVWNPILWEKGIQAIVGVPLLNAGRVIGVLHAGRLADEEFTAEDVQLLEVAAERVAGALQARLAEDERNVAQILQRSLLPPGLPTHPALEFAARYVAAESGVGGDWYDVFVLPSGQVWAVIGDVAGHSLRSAVVMGRLRSVIRAYAFAGFTPEATLTLTNRELGHFEPEDMATAVCAVFESPFDAFRLAVAGHVPPVLALPDQSAQVIEIEGAPPLGCEWRTEIVAATVPLAPGAGVLFYTDGLIERRGEPLDVGLTRLCQVVVPEEPEMLCHRVMAGLIGTAPARDDIAVLAVRRRP